MTEKSKYPFSALYGKALFALRKKNLIVFCVCLPSPNQVTQTVTNDGYKTKFIRSAQNLSKIRRDYPKEFWSLPQIKKEYWLMEDSLKKSIDELLREEFLKDKTERDYGQVLRDTAEIHLWYFWRIRTPNKIKSFIKIKLTKLLGAP